ncbi:hypothetical protein BG006_005108 [Podila minutissima]|uniref:Uncharacterized protein n=1 Tax=Podila minutissima TaxID=64525 RepID=A0A9P5SAA7_9FUNG|nr:hypothetical protein BG006_005108 [Podila minutissima]
MDTATSDTAASDTAASDTATSDMTTSDAAASDATDQVRGIRDDVRETRIYHCHWSGSYRDSSKNGKQLKQPAEDAMEEEDYVESNNLGNVRGNIEGNNETGPPKKKCNIIKKSCKVGCTVKVFVQWLQETSSDPN